MNKEDAEEYTQSLAQICAGSWRQIAWAHKQGIPRALNLTTNEWVRQRLGGYIRLSIEERREAVEELTAANAADEKLSNYEVADIVGVDEATVRRDAANAAPKPRGTLGTGNNEWYTPGEYIELARSVMGKIDLDPASSAVAQEVVRAERWFSEEQNGLVQKWGGRVWLNPPYAQPAIEHFITKLCTELPSLEEAIVLTHNYTDTAWFHSAANNAKSICFTRGRIRFVDAQGNLAAPTQGQAFFYFGEKPGRFADIFKEVGFVR